MTRNMELPTNSSTPLIAEQLQNLTFSSRRKIFIIRTLHFPYQLDITGCQFTSLIAILDSSPLSRHYNFRSWSYVSTDSRVCFRFLDPSKESCLSLFEMVLYSFSCILDGIVLACLTMQHLVFLRWRNRLLRPSADTDFVSLAGQASEVQSDMPSMEFSVLIRKAL